MVRKSNFSAIFQLVSQPYPSFKASLACGVRGCVRSHTFSEEFFSAETNFRLSLPDDVS